MVEANQEICFTTNANLFRGIEGVGGKINVTNEEVVFNAHKLNIQRESVVINIEDIKNIQKRNTLFIVPNGLKIKLNSGEEFKFVVSKRSALVTHINSRIEEYTKESY